MPTLHERLAEQSPTTSGIHEAMARHSEDIFDEFNGILPLLLGKRRLGPFVTLSLPKEITNSPEALISCLSDLATAFDFTLVSFASAIQSRVDPGDAPRLGAILITADNANNLLQLPWNLEFDSELNLSSHSRKETEGEMIPAETWRSLFRLSRDDQSKEMAYDRLLKTFGSASLLPKFAP